MLLIQSYLQISAVITNNRYFTGDFNLKMHFHIQARWSNQVMTFFSKCNLISVYVLTSSWGGVFAVSFL